MLSQNVVLVCFLFALAASSAVEAANGLISLGSHAEEARLVLSTMPKVCTKDSNLISTEYVKTLHSIFNCTYNEIITNGANVALETGAYIAMDYETISKILGRFVSCAQFNVLKLVECGFEQAVNSISEIEGLITSTENFITDMKSMIPPLKDEIENCLSLSSTEYKMFLNNLIHKARTCEKNQ